MFCSVEVTEDSQNHEAPQSRLNLYMKKKAPSSAKPKRRRAVVTSQLRKEAVALIKSGEVAAVVAKRLRVSIATVHNIKKAAGLTKPRKAGFAKKARKK